MPKRTLAQKMETAAQCQACASVCCSLVGENGMRGEDQGQSYSEQNKPHLVLKGETREASETVLGSASMQIT